MAGNTSCVKVPEVREDSCACRNYNLTTTEPLVDLPPKLPDITKFDFTKCMPGWTCDPVIPHCAPCPPNETTTGAPLTTIGTQQTATRTPHIATGTPQTATRTPHIATGTPQIATGTPQTATRTPHIATGTPQIATGSTQTPVTVNVTIQPRCTTAGCPWLLLLPLLLIFLIAAIVYRIWQLYHHKENSIAESSNDPPTSPICNYKIRFDEKASEPHKDPAELPALAHNNPVYENVNEAELADPMEEVLPTSREGVGATTKDESIWTWSATKEAFKLEFEVDQNDEPPEEKTKDKSSKRRRKKVTSTKGDAAK
ncbi:uncharacterized protein LOC119744560 [Patiria miniata]|uniref:Uncharacterized protein n=1 Tax=Patiria miniata TaxID=46514 RepID=A0A914BK31_PATMI|nr:uncharacterized protein LOC119744560 [Patiria miniata]